MHTLFLENNIGTLIQLMITVLLDDPIICNLPIKVIKIDEFLSSFNYKLKAITHAVKSINPSYVTFVLVHTNLYLEWRLCTRDVTIVSDNSFEQF